MKKIVVRASAMEEWVTLVNEAEAAAEHPLDDDMESYLVFLLIRFTDKPELASGVLALDYLRGMQLSGQMAQDQLRDVGDKCLLYSGLFPERATRRRVQASYFVDLGRGAYDQLGQRLKNSSATLYQRLATTFVSLMDVLHAMRELGQPSRLDALHAYELWRDTGSAQALKTLRRRTRATPLALPDKEDGPRH